RILFSRYLYQSTMGASVMVKVVSVVYWGRRNSQLTRDPAGFLVTRDIPGAFLSVVCRGMLFQSPGRQMPERKNSPSFYRNGQAKLLCQRREDPQSRRPIQQCWHKKGATVALAPSRSSVLGAYSADKLTAFGPLPIR